jgi:hypothetical protein
MHIKNIHKRSDGANEGYDGCRHALCNCSGTTAASANFAERVSGQAGKGKTE